jgi:D-alanyl-D-alanine carboxypeptidase
MTSSTQPANSAPPGSPRRRTLKLSCAILACLTAAVLIAASAMAEPTGVGGTRTASLQSDVDALVAAGTPGAILLVRDGNETTRLTGGVSDLVTQRAIEPGDHYRIASLTKTYVATVVLQLAAEGKLRLSDSVERWLPGLVPNGNKITIRMLLNHTSGLYDHEKDPEVLAPYLNGDLGYYWSPIRLVKLAVSRPPYFAPGDTKVASYSSTNYVVLGLIVNAATGRSVGAELRHRIFQPLHLAETTYPTSKTRLTEPYAHGYFILEQPSLTDLSAFSPSLSGPAGAIVSTVDDVAGFYRALLSGRLFKPAQLKAMKTTLPDPKGDLAQRMGYGLIRFSTSCGAAWGHSGSFPGYWTHAWTSANGKRQAVLMVNIDPSSVSDAARAAFYKALDDAYCSTR